MAHSKIMMVDDIHFPPAEDDHVETVATQDDYASAKDVLRNNKSIAAWCLFFAMTAVGWGFDAQVNGAILSVPRFREDFGYIYKGQPILPASWQSAFNSISSVGQFLGGFICSWLADLIGRRAALGIGLVFCAAGIFGEVFATVKVAFLIGKLIVGVGLGFCLTLGPLYCSEISPVALRGLTTSGTNFGIVVGQLLSNSVLRGFGNRPDRWSYRGPLAMQWLFVLILAIGLPWAPESPWYYVRKNDLPSARTQLRNLYGTEFDTEARLATMIKTINDEVSVQGNSKWSDCFKGTNFTRSLISVGVFACQHFTGIIFVLGFSTYFFQLAGLAVEKSFDLGVGVTACGVVGVIISWSLLNNFGRRRLFLCGMISLTTILFLIGIVSLIPTSPAKWVQASLTVIYALFYQSTIGCVAFAVLGETPSAHLRARTIALATATQAIFGIVMNIIVPYMVTPNEANLKGKVGFVFGGLSLLATLWAYFYIPELKGRTFHEIDEIFERKIPARHTRKYRFENGIEHTGGRKEKAGSCHS
ncbi:putative maltose permease [Phaeomoniella chlamydospora]|uniref:Putative maltose permease n=1 Tax=Phaeomoniella chlamydospora TaxID=158046 RepID=A0A0G2GEX1_PHACM|nr:putative maltose permease [Phaeomoniella chlamydospora]